MSEYIKEDGNKYHISQCIQCPECGIFKYQRLNRYNTTLCADCANILDDLEEKISIFDEVI